MPTAYPMTESHMGNLAFIGDPVLKNSFKRKMSVGAAQIAMVSYPCMTVYVMAVAKIIWTENIEYMENITADKNNIAACGLYCGACRKFLSGKCPGCKDNEKASWCKIRQCCISKGYHTCAECKRDVRECKTYSNFISKVFAFIFNSDRPSCISYIREHGEIAYAEEMSRRGCQTIKRNRK